jgi:hypothetical protein
MNHPVPWAAETVVTARSGHDAIDDAGAATSSQIGSECSVMPDTCLVVTLIGVCAGNGAEGTGL